MRGVVAIYDRMSAVHVRMDDEKLKISNPGGLMDGVTLANLRGAEGVAGGKGSRGGGDQRVHGESIHAPRLISPNRWRYTSCGASPLDFNRLKA